MDERTRFRVPEERVHWKALAGIETAQLRQLPDAIIIGAQKAGTTSLNRYLGDHPDIGIAKSKEVHYFSMRFDNGMDWYQAHFPLRGKAATVVEDSPSYLFHPEAPRRMKQILPRVKLIALLRNPVDRAFSHYQMNVRKGNEPLSFEEAIAAESERVGDGGDGNDQEWRVASFVSYLRRGLYAEQLQRWLAVFARNQVLVLKSEEFFQHPEPGFERVLAFLGLQPWQLPRYENFRPGEYAALRPETRTRLRDFFAPHNQQLYALLGEDFGWEVEEH
jgi:hypothetical protein